MVSTILTSQVVALLSDLLGLASPTPLVLGEGGVSLCDPMLLGEAKRCDGKKDPGLPESLVPSRALLSETDRKKGMLLTPTEGVPRPPR